mgnify:CR=1 FL=1
MFLRYGFVLFASTLAVAMAHAAIYTVGGDDTIFSNGFDNP